MTESEAIARVQAGDYRAFEALYHYYSRQALRSAYLITRDLSSAEDAVQDAFVQVWKTLSQLRNPEAFRAWFYRILLRCTYQVVKKRRGEAAMPEWWDAPDLTAVGPDERLVAAEDVAHVRAALRTLPPSHRTPLVLRYFAGLTDAEIAAVLEVPVGTAKSRLHNGRQALLQAFRAIAQVSSS